MTLPAPVREWLVLWPVWQEIAGYVSTGDPRTVDPHDIYGAACGYDRDRLAACLYGCYLGDSLDEAHGLLAEVLALAQNGRRPRFGRELGFTAELFR